MSYQDGLAAINLEMPDKVPRMEFSVERYWALIEKITGIKVDSSSSEAEKQKASSALVKAWDYGFYWNVVVHSNQLDKCRTKMGHANYEAGNVDYDNEVLCPFEDPEDAFDFDPMAVYGTKNHAELVKMFNDDYKQQQLYYPDTVCTTGTYISLVSGVLEIFGWDILLMAMGIDAKAFGEVTNRYAKWMQQYFNAFADSDVPIMVFHDDIAWTSGPFAQPDWYREFVFPNYKKYFAPLHEAGKKIIYTSDGNYTQFVDDIAACGVNGFVMEPCTDMKYIAEKYGKTHSFMGNADTRVLLYGSREDIYNEVKRCMDIGKNCPGFIMGVGNHIPSNTPIESCLYYNEVYEKLSRR